MQQRCLTDDLTSMIRYLETVERTGYRLPAPKQYEVLVLLECARDKILMLQGENDILRTAGGEKHACKHIL